MVLVHACCGPCSVTVVQGLRAQGHDLLGFYYNPNIHPLMEYLRRREALEAVAARLDFPVAYADSEYDPAAFLRRTAFREKERCVQCYRLRLERAALEARRRGCSAMTTTLLYSKYQDHEAIRIAGERAAAAQGVEFLYQDFRTGWEEGIRLSKEWGVYRQPYCGCLFSEFERYSKRLSR